MKRPEDLSRDELLAVVTTVRNLMYLGVDDAGIDVFDPDQNVEGVRPGRGRRFRAGTVRTRARIWPGRRRRQCRVMPATFAAPTLRRSDVTLADCSFAAGIVRARSARRETLGAFPPVGGAADLGGLLPFLLTGVVQLKTVTLTVRFTATVPDDAPTRLLCLDLPEAVDVSVADVQGRTWCDEIVAYETIDVKENAS